MSDKQPIFLEQYGQHIALWFCILLALGVVMGLGLVTPVLPFMASFSLPPLSTSAIGVGLVTALSLGVYSWLSLEISQIKRGDWPPMWSMLRAGRLGVALVPVVWLVLLATVSWSAPALLGLACLTPLAMTVFQGAIGQFFLNALFERSIQDYPADYDNFSWIEKAFLWLGADINMALPHAAYRGDRALDWLLESGADINGCVRVDRQILGDNQSRPPLACVVEARHEAMSWRYFFGRHPEMSHDRMAEIRQSVLQAVERAAMRLLDRGADPDILIYFSPRANYWLITWSMKEERYALMKRLIAMKPGLLNNNCTDKAAGLILAAANNDFDMVASFINEQGVSVNARWSTRLLGASPHGCALAIRAAAANGHAEMVRRLCGTYNADLDLGGDQNQWSREQCATELAAQKGHVDVVRVLLAFNAQQPHPQQDFRYALELAIRHSHCDVIQAFVDAGRAGDKQVLLESACNWGSEEVVRFLCQFADVDVNAFDGSGCTPMMHAARYKHVGVILALSGEGADPMATDWSERSLRFYANQLPNIVMRHQAAQTVHVVEGLMNGARQFCRVNIFDPAVSVRQQIRYNQPNGGPAPFPFADMVSDALRPLFFTIFLCRNRLRAEAEQSVQRSWFGQSWFGPKKLLLPDLSDEMWMEVIGMQFLVTTQERHEQPDGRLVAGKWRPVNKWGEPRALGWKKDNGSDGAGAAGGPGPGVPIRG